MTDPLADQGGEKQHAVADACNQVLQNLNLECTRDDGVRHYFDIGVLGYGSDEYFNPIIQSFHLDSCSFEPVVTSNDDPPVSQWQNLLIPISELSANQKLETRTQKQVDEESGELIEFEIQYPYWVRPVARGGTTVCRALYDCFHLLECWIENHPENFPPILLHLTDGEFRDADGDPEPYTESLTNLATEDGHVLLFNSLPSGRDADQSLYPADESGLSDEIAKRLFRMSSRLPETFCRHVESKGMGHLISTGSRAFACNADVTSVLLAMCEISEPITRLR